MRQETPGRSGGGSQHILVMGKKFAKQKTKTGSILFIDPNSDGMARLL